MAGASRAARSTDRDSHGRWLWRLVSPVFLQDLGASNRYADLHGQLQELRVYRLRSVFIREKETADICGTEIREARYDLHPSA